MRPIKTPCRKKLAAFILSPDILFLSLRKTPSFSLPLILMLTVQIVIVFLPALFNSTNLSPQGVSGILIVIITVICMKLTLSAVFMHFISVVFSDGSKQLPFRYCFSAAVMVQWIILSGKILAALVGGILVLSNPELQFIIPSFPNAAIPFRILGIYVPELLFDIDVFTVWYIVALTQLFHVVMKMPLWFSVICSIMNWSLIMITQKTLLTLTTSSFHGIAR